MDKEQILVGVFLESEIKVVRMKIIGLAQVIVLLNVKFSRTFQTLTYKDQNM